MKNNTNAQWLLDIRDCLKSWVRAQLRINKPAFSLMEMMVTMLIVAIIIALSAPMVAKRNQTDNVDQKIWKLLEGGNTAFNAKTDKKSAVIGGEQKTINNAATSLAGNIPVLTLNTKNSNPHLAFMYDGELKGVIHMNKGIAIGNNPQTYTRDSIAIGNKAFAGDASGTASDSQDYGPIAIGTRATCHYDGVVAIGSLSKATSNHTIAIGHDADATKEGAIGLGCGANALGNETLAIARDANATGSNSTAIGYHANSQGTYSIAVGHYANAVTTSGSIAANNAIAIGRNSDTFFQSIAIGNLATTKQQSSIAIGSEAKITSGYYTSYNGIAIGNKATANLNNPVAIGGGANAYTQAVAIGQANAAGISAISIGGSSAAKGIYSIGIGDSATSAGARAVSIGSESFANKYSVSLGKSSSSGGYSVALGRKSSVQDDSVALGNNAIGNYYAVSIGNNSNAANYSVSIGYNAQASGENAVSIGSSANAGDYGAIAIGGGGTDYDKANAYGSNSIAIGIGSYASGENSAAIGVGARAIHSNSTAFGYNAQTTMSNQLVLGDANTTIRIPGKLLIGGMELGDVYLKGNLLVYGNTVLGSESGSSTLIRSTAQGEFARMYEYRGGSESETWYSGRNGSQSGSTSVSIDGVSYTYNWYSSDRRLKDIIGENLDAMDKINRLKVYNFTYKNDGLKTPHIGVMAQDLRKIFPYAVTKDENGYLQIRHEDIFYTMVNALKELDTRVKKIVADLADNIKFAMQNSTKLASLEKADKNQDTALDNIEFEINELKKRIKEIR